MILTVDSSTNIASVSLTHDGEILYSHFINGGKTHSQKLMPMIDECFKKTGNSPKNTDAFAAIAGPGSFTGLRIGIAAIQGLAYASKKPCISISALDAMACGAKPFDGLIAPLIDARNAQAYSSVYDGNNSLKKVMEDSAGSVEKLAKAMSSLNQNVLFLGDGAYKNKELILTILGERAFFLNEKESYTTSNGAALLAQLYYDTHKTVDPKDLIPYYFRDTSAKKKFK